jgi:hypothetical protein
VKAYIDEQGNTHLPVAELNEQFRALQRDYHATTGEWLDIGDAAMSLCWDDGKPAIRIDYGTVCWTLTFDPETAAIIEGIAARKH